VLYVDDETVECVIKAPRGSRAFKRSNPWLSTLDHLPYTALYASGEKVDEFAASKGFFLMERAEDAGFI
jgi:hypothetical protein